MTKEKAEKSCYVCGTPFSLKCKHMELNIKSWKWAEDCFKDDVQEVLATDPSAASRKSKYENGLTVLVPDINNKLIRAEIMKSKVGIYMLKHDKGDGTFKPVICPEFDIVMIN
ncbi:MAG: hypothetical protein ABIH87_00190 [bacterium]